MIIGMALLTLGCSTPVHTMPPQRTVEYLAGIAGGHVDECGVTYALLCEYREAAIPVVLKALDLYSVPTNAPSARCRILNGVSWTYRLWGNERVSIVDQIMVQASKNPNPDISNRAKQWLDWRKTELTKSAEPGTEGDGLKPVP